MSQKAKTKTKRVVLEEGYLCVEMWPGSNAGVRMIGIMRDTGSIKRLLLPRNIYDPMKPYKKVRLIAEVIDES